MDPSQIPDSKWDIYEKLWNSSSVLGSRSDFVTVAFLNMQWWRLELTEILAPRCSKSRFELSALRSSVLPSKDGIPWSLKGYISMELHKHIQVNQSSSQTHLSCCHTTPHSWERRTKHSLAAAWPQLSSLRCTCWSSHTQFLHTSLWKYQDDNYAFKV